MSRPSTSSSCSIFVGNVPYDAQEDELRDLFCKVGNVTSVRVVCDKDTKQPKGYAFVDFSDSDTVSTAIEKLNNVEYNGRKLRVDCAERELHTPASKPMEERERGGSRLSGPGPSPADPPPLPVPTVADRLARLRDQEEAEKARVAAAENAERAEIARLMETLTPKQIIHILGEMQRLALKAPEVARALVSENMQLALALQHAQFLAGLTDEPPLPSEPAVTERARNVRQHIWGCKAAPAPAPPSRPTGHLGGQVGVVVPPQQTQLALLALPAPPLVTTGGVRSSPYGAPPMLPPGATSTVPSMGYAVARPRPVAAPRPLEPQGGTSAISPEDPRCARQPGSGDEALAQASAMSNRSRSSLLEKLVQLSPAEIDKLPHDTKVQLLEFLQTLPPQSQTCT